MGDNRWMSDDKWSRRHPKRPPFVVTNAAWRQARRHFVCARSPICGHARRAFGLIVRLNVGVCCPLLSTFVPFCPLLLACCRVMSGSRRWQAGHVTCDWSTSAWHRKWGIVGGLSLEKGINTDKKKRVLTAAQPPKSCNCPISKWPIKGGC